MIATALQPLIDRKHLAGAVTMVATAEKVLDITCLGYADVSAAKPMTPSTLFWIASTTKPMTAALVMMLVDAGKLDVSDPVEKYLPEFKGIWCVAEQIMTPGPNPVVERIVLMKPSHAFTIAECLTHTSGLPFLSRAEPVIDARPLREACVGYATGHLLFDPGTKYHYANGGSNTLGRVVEVVAGMPYEQFLQTQLLDPLGMTDTTFFPSAEQLTRLAKSYRGDETTGLIASATLGQFLNPFPGRPRYAAPGGGLFSTAADVTRFGQMILRGGEWGGKQILSRDSVRAMTGTKTGVLHAPDGPGTGYGYHFRTYRQSTSDGPSPAGACGHAGAYGNDLLIDPDAGLVMTLMVQQANWPQASGPHHHKLFHEAARQTFASQRQN